MLKVEGSFLVGVSGLYLKAYLEKVFLNSGGTASCLEMILEDLRGSRLDSGNPKLASPVPCDVSRGIGS